MATDLDGNVHVVPTGKDQPKHTEAKDCWCEPELAADYTHLDGVKLYVHRELQ